MSFIPIKILSVLRAIAPARAGVVEGDDVEMSLVELLILGEICRVSFGRSAIADVVRCRACARCMDDGLLLEDIRGVSVRT